MSPKEQLLLLQWFSQQGMSDKAQSILKQHLNKPNLVEQISRFREGFHKKTKAIFLDGFPTHFIGITVDDTRMHADLTVISYVEDVPRLQSQIEGIASSIGLPLDEFSQDCIQNLLRRNLWLEPCIHEVLIQGTPPIMAKASDVRFFVKTFSTNPQYDENDQGSVDFHNLNLFQNVIENQHIADHIPPEPGAPGKDAFGQIIPQNSDKKSNIVCGPGVAFDEEQGQYISTRAGFVTFENQRISVEDTYVVEKDVDMGVGNINFVSAVTVKGDVLPDFSIQAAGSILVYGTVTGATLISDKNVNLKLGLLGQGKGMARTGGNFSAKFVNDCRLEVSGSIEILTEAMNSRIGAIKNINAREAVFIGGQVVSIGKMHLGTVGSELGLPTSIFLGEDFSCLKRTEEVRRLIEEKNNLVEGRMEGLQDEVKFWQNEHSKETLKTDAIEILQQKIVDVKAMLNDLILAHQEYELLSQNIPKDRDPVCIVQRKIYSGTTFYFSGEILRIRETIVGPVIVKGEESGRPGHYRISVSKL